MRERYKGTKEPKSQRSARTYDDGTKRCDDTAKKNFPSKYVAYALRKKGHTLLIRSSNLKRPLMAFTATCAGPAVSSYKQRQ